MEEILTSLLYGLTSFTTANPGVGYIVYITVWLVLFLMAIHLHQIGYIDRVNNRVNKYVKQKESNEQS